jgi:hypothetical protein
MNDPFLMLKTIAEGLGSLREDVVFTGGATVSLYVQDKAARRFRNTDDVDCVIGISTRKQYRDLEKRLQSLGLLNQFERYDFCLRGKKEYSITEIFSFSKGRINGHDNKRV